METHSFDIQDVPAFLKSASVRQVLVQALLDAPMFEVRWRWNATIALAVQRMRNGQKLPPQWQRNQAEDLVAVIFPDQLACLENIRGEREIPDHPLVQQTIDDCLGETMDILGLEHLLQQIENGEIDIRCMDLTAPSPLSAEIINARPYAFLDDGDAENRRTRAISQNTDDLGQAAMLSIISVDAKEQVRSEAWIQPRSPDELHDGLLQLGFVSQTEYASGCSNAGAVGDSRSWDKWFQALTGEMRACCVRLQESSWWVATERLEEFQSVHPSATAHPDPSAVIKQKGDLDQQQALVELLRSRLAGLGPVDVELLVEDFQLPQSRLVQALIELQTEGYAIRVNPPQNDKAPPVGDGLKDVWCERRLLARIHRYSRERRRKAARPVPPAAFMRFLLDWHGLGQPAGELEQALALLEGWAAPVAAWETGLLATRCADYTPQRLDEQFLSGFLTWFRPLSAGLKRQQLVAATPIAVVPRRHLAGWHSSGAQSREDSNHSPPEGIGARLLQSLEKGGAMFSDDLERESGLLRPQFEQAIAALVAQGQVTADAFSPLRWLIRPEAEKRKQEKALRRRRLSPNSQLLGRWSTISVGSPGEGQGAISGQALLAIQCEALLRRYGVVFRAVLERENLLQPWRHLLRYLRRMEDRGEVYGGRFVDGFSGEQFALPEAIGLLRRHAVEPAHRKLKVINAADPLNLGGFITAGVRTPAKPGNRILLGNGVPAARLVSGEVELLKGANVTPSEAERHLRIIVASSLTGEQAIKPQEESGT